MGKHTERERNNEIEHHTLILFLCCKIHCNLVLFRFRLLWYVFSLSIFAIGFYWAVNACYLQLTFSQVWKDNQCRWTWHRKQFMSIKCWLLVIMIVNSTTNRIFSHMWWYHTHTIRVWSSSLLHLVLKNQSIKNGSTLCVGSVEWTILSINKWFGRSNRRRWFVERDLRVEVIVYFFVTLFRYTTLVAMMIIFRHCSLLQYTFQFKVKMFCGS